MWVTHLIAATSVRSHADVQGHISGHAPGDKHEHAQHLLTTATHHKQLSEEKDSVDETMLPTLPTGRPGSTATSFTTSPRSTRPGPTRLIDPQHNSLGNNTCDELIDPENNSVGNNKGAVMSRDAPVDMIQGGAGTSTNTNANEVIANRALEHLGKKKGEHKPGSTATQSIGDRLATIATTLRIQDATGTSHLQQLEIDPEAFGVAKSSRPHIKSLRLQRNRALHGAKHGGEPPPSSIASPISTTSNISGTTPVSALARTTATTSSVTTTTNIRPTTSETALARASAKTSSVTKESNIRESRQRAAAVSPYLGRRSRPTALTDVNGEL